MFGYDCLVDLLNQRVKEFLVAPFPKNCEYWAYSVLFSAFLKDNNNVENDGYTLIVSHVSMHCDSDDCTTHPFVVVTVDENGWIADCPIYCVEIHNAMLNRGTMIFVGSSDYEHFTEALTRGELYDTYEI